MRANELILHCLGRKEGDQWVVMSLEFSLAAQADSLEQAKAMLQSQIREYLTDALIGQDKAHAEELLSRRAPLKYWAQYWLARCIRGIGNHTLVKTFRQPLPLAPAHA
ncbi:MAG: hypothetical protein WCA85_25935 [Paraburkholderia sp.]|uniref:hypothetical protein n=1 Tax=Paraburkholderia sp. TaxID=1926495 RepID=UPI003C43FC1B